MRNLFWCGLALVVLSGLSWLSVPSVRSDLSARVDWRFLSDLVIHPVDLCREALTGEVGGIWSASSVHDR